MIRITEQAVRDAEKAMAHMPHMEVLRTYLPGILEADVDNSISVCGDRSFRAAVYNMETGNRLELLLPYLERHPGLAGTDIILANELDIGMARSGCEDTPKKIAEALGMNYAFGVEFVTVDAFRKGNREGLGGNAIFSKYPLENVHLIHFPIQYDWFFRSGDSRLGVRMAVAAEVKVGGRSVCVCSAHLCNRVTPAGRADQMRCLLTELDRLYGSDMPVLLGGDMNTNTVDGDAIDGYRFLKDREEAARRIGEIPRWEPLMLIPEQFGYRYDTANIFSKVTRRKPEPSGDIVMNLDWFFTRKLEASDPQVILSIFDHTSLRDGEAYEKYDGRLISDHDAVVATIGLPEE